MFSKEEWAQIFLPSIFFLSNSSLGNTTSLPRISSTSTNFICSKVIKSFSISSKLGNYFPSVLIQSLELIENSNNNEITLFLKYSIANTNSTDNLELNFT